MRLLHFLLRALWHRHVYVDMDGCLLHRCNVPAHVPEAEALAWWRDNLCVTPIVRRRLVLLYALRLCGVHLHIWTNRGRQHRRVTYTALGRHARLFEEQHFCTGTKNNVARLGPCIDDQSSNIGGHAGDMLVKSIGPNPRRDPL